LSLILSFGGDGSVGLLLDRGRNLLSCSTELAWIHEASFLSYSAAAARYTSVNPRIRFVVVGALLPTLAVVPPQPRTQLSNLPLRVLPRNPFSSVFPRSLQIQAIDIEIRTKLAKQKGDREVPRRREGMASLTRGIHTVTMVDSRQRERR
jgi:hypothetical protein